MRKAEGFRESTTQEKPRCSVVCACVCLSACPSVRAGARATPDSARFRLDGGEILAGRRQLNRAHGCKLGTTTRKSHDHEAQVTTPMMQVQMQAMHTHV